MVTERPLEEIFEPAEDGMILLSEDIPDVLANAVEDATTALDRNTEYILRDVGVERRALDYGAENLGIIETKSATLFCAKLEEGHHILSVGVSNAGPLTENQVEDVLWNLAREAKLTTEETLETTEASTALSSIRQAREFIAHNCREVSDEVANLELMLVPPVEHQESISNQADLVAAKFHNLLSSVYTFSETVDRSISRLGVARESKHHLQKYKDEVSTAIGIRHCIQHSIALQISWVAEYSHEKEIFLFSVGVPLSQVNEPNLYHNHPISDVSGEKHEPVDYYYGESSGYLIDIDNLSSIVETATNAAYKNLKSSLLDQDIEPVEILKRHNRTTETYLRQFTDDS